MKRYGQYSINTIVIWGMDWDFPYFVFQNQLKEFAKRSHSKNLRNAGL